MRYVFTYVPAMHVNGKIGWIETDTIPSDLIPTVNRLRKHFSITLDRRVIEVHTLKTWNKLYNQLKRGKYE